jgi:hypothetical protein
MELICGPIYIYIYMSKKIKLLNAQSAIKYTGSIQKRQLRRRGKQN